MASLTCPNCGKDNPDFLDDCQFCQTPLRREATLNIGENPTKKSTGELEGVLPDWLRDARQQARDSAEEEAAKEATKPKIQKEEPLDLLAGLAFQTASDEEEVPDWLSAINPVQDKKIPASSKPVDENKPSDFFAQLEGSNQQLVDTSPTIPMPGETAQDEPLPWTSGNATEPQKDELTDWFSQTAAPPNEPFAFDAGETPASRMDRLNVAASQEPAASEQPEDLSWLRDLEASTKQQPSAPTASSADTDWISNLDSSSGTQEDLSWLNNLGGMPAPASQPESQPEDLNWLNNLGGTPLADEPTLSQPASAKEDLSWLNNLGGTTAEPAPSQPAPSADDLDWLNNLGETPAPALSEPSAPQENLNWLDNLGGTPATPPNEPAPFAQPDVPDWLKKMEAQPPPEAAQPPKLSPRQTAPLSEDAMREMPDWLKSATEASASPSMPPLGAAAKDRLASKQPADKRKLDEVSGQPSGLQTSSQMQESSPALAPGASVASAQDVPAPDDQNFFSTSTDASLTNQDVDALFAVDMPDWLSQPESAARDQASAQEGAVSPGSVDELAPVDLPSWVQAMRPMEAVMGEASAISADQTTEREGPLAGLRGVIPLAPIGSAQRPKAISLKLQATAEQQAGASLVEQIIGSEASAQPLKVSPFISSQRALRWGLTALFMLVLSAVIALGSHFLPISAELPVEVNNAVSAITTLPESAPVLVVMDYEPSLAGEIEAVAGPLLDQMVVLRRPTFTFVSTSPNGTGLVDRLLVNNKISSPVSDGGLGYQIDAQYFNAGYLPGGSAGVRGFTEAPQSVLPSVKVNLFSEFAAVVVITDHAESGQMWIEQVTLAKQSDPFLANQQLLVVASAKAGPMLRPYISSKQVAGLISGIPDAARYEYVNNSRPGIVRSYWDAFGAGLFLAIVSIVIGSLWSLFTGIRARRAETEPG